MKRLVLTIDLDEAEDQMLQETVTSMNRATAQAGEKTFRFTENSVLELTALQGLVDKHKFYFRP